MAYVVIDDFKLGLDRRRARSSGIPGSLWTLVNAHLTRGGEVERRKRFVAKYADLGGTFGMATASGLLYVFGSAASSTAPAGVTYQRLQHPDGVTAMSRLVYAEAFDGAVYAIAEFEDGSVFHFYDGAIVTDWLAGIVRADMTDNDGIAAHLATLIDADVEVTASSAGAVITITGAEGEALTVTATAENGGAVDDETAVAATTQVAVAGTAETLASCSFTIKGGALSAGVNKITEVNVNAVNTIDTEVDWSSSNAVTAANIAAAINSYTSTPNYTATANGATVTISAASGAGATPNGFVLEVVTEGEVVTTNGEFTVTGGTSNPGVNTVSSITVNGVTITSAAVDWATSHSAFAAALAANINAFTSAPDYVATAEGPVVKIGKVESDSNDTTFTLVVNVTGDVTVGSQVNVSPTATVVSGGVASAPGQAQITTVTIGGTFDAGDRFTVEIESADNGTRTYGAGANPTPVGQTALTFKGSIYSVAGSLAHRSAVNSATVWNRDNEETPGAAFINAASQEGGSGALTGAGIYQGSLALFARNGIQIWAVDADPGVNAFLTSVPNTGTRSPKSILAYGALDTFYLSDSGIRSLRPRDSSSSAYMNDVGVAIDDLVQDYMATLTDTQVERAAAVLQPFGDRYMLVLGGRIFVLSYFPGSNVSAWSYYDTADDIGGTITDVVRVADALYARSGDVIYLYGGDAGTTYPGDDECEVDVDLPFFDAKSPATFKEWEGFDLLGTGQWEVWALPDVNREEVEHKIGTVTRNTVNQPQFPFSSEAPLIALRLRCSKAGAAKLSKIMAHYKAIAAA